MNDIAGLSGLVYVYIFAFLYPNTFARNIYNCDPLLVILLAIFLLL